MALASLHDCVELTIEPMKIPTQPKDDKDYFRMYRIPIKLEENVPESEKYTRAPYVLSKRLNKPRKNKSHIHKTGAKSFYRMMGYEVRHRGWFGCGCCHDENGERLGKD